MPNIPCQTKQANQSHKAMSGNDQTEARDSEASASLSPSKRSLSVRVEPVNEMIAVSVGADDDILERGETTNTHVKETVTPKFWTQKKVFFMSCLLVLVILGTLIGVFVSRSGPPNEGAAPQLESTYTGRNPNESTPPSDCCDCDANGYFCFYPEGDCGAGDEGECLLRPEMCTEDYRPVCGCDQVTYGNECGANEAGVSIDYQGECDSIVPKTTGCDDCDATGYFCSYTDGDCGAGDEGECILKPEMCTMDYIPVCGCNGVTYGNRCGANADGVSVDYVGECEDIAPGSGCNACDGDAVLCLYPEGDCGTSQQGVCSPKPELCPRIEDPVCGCDGNSYGNDCVANEMGVSVDYRGECAP